MLHDVLTMSKCMLPAPERGIAAMLTRRVDDFLGKKTNKKINIFLYHEHEH